MYQEEDFIGLLKRIGAVEQVHVQLASGRHALEFMDFKIAFAYPTTTWKLLCHAMAQLIIRNRGNLPLPDVILGPSNGGIAVSGWIAEHLTNRFYVGKDNEQKEVLALFTEKVGSPNGVSRFKLKSAYQRLVDKKTVYVIDDVFTTGSSARKSAEEVRRAGGSVALFGCFWNREGLTSDQMDGIPVMSLINRPVPSFDPGPDTCPGCRDKLPLRTKIMQ